MRHEETHSENQNYERGKGERWGRELEREDEGATERGQKYEEENKREKGERVGVKDKSKEISGREKVGGKQ